VRSDEEVAPARPLTRDGRPLPSVISWLDPEMSATPRRGAADAAFPLLRPPGAIEEVAFLEACTRCGDCAKACPHDVIRDAGERLREAAATPIIDPLSAPCEMCEDLPCIAACETGALRPEAPAALGTARVQPLDCLNRLSASCSVCVERCPVPGAMAFAGDVPAVNEALCTGCGVCQHVCPAPQNAILILPNPQRPVPAALDSLPELHEGELDEAALRALFRDLGALTEVEEVRLKRAAGRRAESGAPGLDEALAKLLSGDVRGVQVRYRYLGESWCDTVLPAPGGHRVVRMAQPTRGSASEPSP
jgi:ferredoxin-type protein NapG